MKDIDVSTIWSAVKNRDGEIKEGEKYDFGYGSELICAIQTLPDRIWVQTESRNLYYYKNGIFSESKKHKYVVLVVGEYEDHMQSIVALIEMSGVNCEVFECDGGESALEYFDSNSDIDLIVTDNKMARGDGVWLIKSIRKRSGVPIVIFSGVLNKIEDGRTYLFNKPLDVDAFLKKVKEILGS